MLSRRSMLYGLSLVLVLFLLANLYFLCIVIYDSKNDNIQKQRRVQRGTTLHDAASVDDGVLDFHTNLGAIKLIKRKLSTIEASGQLRSTYLGLIKKLKHDSIAQLKARNVWVTAAKWVTGRQVIPESAPFLGAVLNSLAMNRIIASKVGVKGTQLKMTLILQGGQQVVFKPKWYSQEVEISGSVYNGKDRHDAEIVAFHLSRLLDLRRVPITVGRSIHLQQEILPVASKKLKETFFSRGNETCFYGVCYYCKPSDPVCDNGTGTLDGAVVLWLPDQFRLKSIHSPWRRTYKSSKARWQVEQDYCNRIKHLNTYNPLKGPQLLDLVDASIFDFLMGNGDRHHYEVFSNITRSMVLLLDNGKSFRNSSEDHLDILAPLYQCCIIRNSTWNRLKLFHGNSLGDAVRELTLSDPLSPLLTDRHFASLDRRLLAVRATVSLCVEQKSAENVFINDRLK